MLLNELKNQFQKPNNSIIQLIWINSLVFFAIRILGVILEMFVFKQEDVAASVILPYISLSDNLSEFLHFPWTIVTACFTHWDFMHVALNMLGLYMIGQIFIAEFGDKRLVGLYLFAGIGANIIYFIVQNTLDFYTKVPNTLVGASGAITGLFIALATFYPNKEVMLFFVLRVKLVWLAIILVAMYAIQLTGPNGGGHVCHLGGALMGFLFAKAYKNGTDLTKPILDFLLFIENLFKKKAKIKVSHSNFRNQTASKIEDVDYTEISQAKIDEILDKLKVSGYASLSKEEKRILFDYSKQ